MTDVQHGRAVSRSRHRGRRPAGCSPSLPTLATLATLDFLIGRPADRARRAAQLEALEAAVVRLTVAKLA